MKKQYTHNKHTITKISAKKACAILNKCTDRVYRTVKTNETANKSTLLTFVAVNYNDKKHIVGFASRNNNSRSDTYKKNDYIKKHGISHVIEKTNKKNDNFADKTTTFCKKAPPTWLKSTVNALNNLS